MDLCRCRIRESARQNFLCVQAAKKRAAELQSWVSKDREAVTDEVSRLLDRAEAIGVSDMPTARTMAEAIVDLYGSKSWMSEQVKRAERLVQADSSD